MRPLSNDFLSMWEHIINGVEISKVPIECIRSMVLKLENRKQRTINVQTLRKQGLEHHEIEALVSRQLQEMGGTVRRIEFLVDVEMVADLVQPVTDDLLKNL